MNIIHNVSILIKKIGAIKNSEFLVYLESLFHCMWMSILKTDFRLPD